MPLEIKMGRIFEESADVLVLDTFYSPTDNERKEKIRRLRQKAPYAASYINNTTDNPLFQDTYFDKSILLNMYSFANLCECERYDICEEQKYHRCTPLRTYDKQFGAHYLLFVKYFAKLTQSVSAKKGSAYPEYGCVIHYVIFSILQFLEKLGIHSVKMPVFGLETPFFPIEIKVLLTIEAVKAYLQLYGDPLHVTIVLSNNGLPEDLHSRCYNETDGFIKALEQIYADKSYDPTTSLKDTVKQLCSHGFDISEDYRSELGLISEIQMMEKQFRKDRRKEIISTGITEEEYGRRFMLKMQEQYEFSDYKLANITKKSKHTFVKFRKGITKKYSKITLLCIALAMELPLEDFCRYIWAGGEAFPCDDRDRMIRSNIEFGMYDIDTIDEEIAYELGESQRLTKPDQETNTSQKNHKKSN